MSERIGLFGGTFDPIHNAHLAIARAAAAECALVSVLLVPAAHPPHRRGGSHASYADRLQMVALACEGDTLLAASRLDDTPGPSYSLETVERYLAGSGAGDALFYVIGADAFAEIRSWHRWRDLANLVSFAVVGRPGAAYEIPEGVRVRRVEGLELETSSSDIRKQLASGSVVLDIPLPVRLYIEAHGLYKPFLDHTSQKNT